MKMLYALAMLLFAQPCLALSADEPLADIGQEGRARHLFHEIRCVVCAGESIADSPAQVAQDMRREVRTQIAGGRSDEEIKEMLTRQYGEKVLMRPPFEKHSFLWLSPGMFLLLGLLAAWWLLFRRKNA